jgi:hypothetical protein
VKDDLHRYLKAGRAAMLWKLEGLSEYDIRRPMTPTGTNLLGLVKHLAGVEAGYFGDTFGRPFPDAHELPDVDGEANVDMWATADESREHIISLYQRACAHSDTTIEELELDSEGHVPWWPADRATPSLHRVLVHMIAETHRHAGQADIVREYLDGEVGMQKGNDNMPESDREYWQSYRARLEEVATAMRDRESS